jgi:hypothetical protein
MEIIQGEQAPASFRYVAISLVGGAGVAVLGARRPGVVAWNFVVIALFAVMLFLLVESRLGVDDRILNRLKIVSLCSTAAIGILNYLPTSLAPAAILLALSCAFEVSSLAGSNFLGHELVSANAISRLMMALVPWASYIGIRWRTSPRSEFDQRWLGFRDRFGLVWGQRLREQFNQSAKHASWPVVLRWSGLRLVPGTVFPDPAAQHEMLNTLQALMKRFQICDS